MKTAIGVASGFFLVVAILGLTIGFVSLMVRYNVGKADFVIGAFLAMVLLISGFLIAVKLS